MGHQGTPGLDSLSGGVSVQFPPHSTPGLCSLSGGVQRTLQGNNLYFNDPFSSTNSSNLSSLRTLSLTTCRFLLMSFALSILLPKDKINVTFNSPVGDISVVALTRTDTTLDHSQKAEKVSSFKLQLLAKLQLASFQGIWKLFPLEDNLHCPTLSESASPPCLGPGSVITVIGQRYWPALLRL